MRIDSHQLLNELKQQTQINIAHAQQIQQLAIDKLTWRSEPTSWNVLECFEHLNRYGDYYHPQMMHKIATTKTKADTIFESGMLGNFFAESMQPKATGKKYKTFKDKNPLHSSLDKTVVQTFLTQQQQLLELLEQSENVSLNNVRIRTTITSLIKLKLGDMFRFLIAHNTRHLNQAQKVLTLWQQQ
jgi:hypothetical protein